MIWQPLLKSRVVKKTYFICTYLCLLVFVASSQNNSNENNWTGTITYVSTLRTHHAAPYSDFIYKMWNHFYEQRMEAKLINSKGTATFDVSLIDTNYNREKEGSRIIEQWETEKGSAAGSADAQVSIFIDQSAKTYSIEVPIPAATGNKIKTIKCNGCGQPDAAPVTSSMGEDETSIMVESEKLGVNPNILTGKKTERKQIDNGEGEEIITTQWKFTRVIN